MKEKKIMRVSTNRLNVRTEPKIPEESERNTIDQVKEGEHLAVLGEKEGWVNVEYVRIGWVNAKYVVSEEEFESQPRFKFAHNPLREIFITQKFGLNPKLYSKWELAGHNGIDLRTRSDDNPDNWKKEVFAILSGKVIEAKNDLGHPNGKFIRLAHSEKSRSVYCHLDSVEVSIGQEVKAGDVIGISGNTGASDGPHLHFGFCFPKPNINNGFRGYVDPEPYFLP